MILTGWADNAWANGSWVPASWGVTEDDEGFSGVYARERRRRKREQEKQALREEAKAVAKIPDQELAAILLWMM